MEISTTQSLLEALDERGQTPEERKSFDDEVWRQRGAKGAILVTDLSGFTRATKTHGVIHFLSIFRRFQNSCGPLLEKNGGHLFKQEADDLLLSFLVPARRSKLVSKCLEPSKLSTKYLAPSIEWVWVSGLIMAHSFN